MDFDADRLLKISPNWWGAIASVAAAGAILVPTRRIVADAVAGLALLALAYYKTPCCAGCAAGAGCGSGASSGAGSPMPLPPVPVMDPAVSKMLAGQALPSYSAGGGGTSSTYGNRKCFS